MTDLISSMLPEIESELMRQVSRLDEEHSLPFKEMLTYHLGWTGDGAGEQATGKRIRPLLLLLTAASCGMDWKKALPAAAAVELVHNFSLVHDDIQDNSPERRGRPTVWVKWGSPLAINVGDALFALSTLALTDLGHEFPHDRVLESIRILQQTCLDLTRGQYLDMSFEDRTDVKVEDYWLMVTGKTASLLSASCHIGAVLGNVDESTEEAYRSFGHFLGLAFQVQDDILGIWGDENVTGKSAASDLIERKKSLPVLAGLSKQGKFAEFWNANNITPENVEEAAKLLASDSAYTYTHDIAKQMTDMANNSLREADPQGEAGDTLMDLADRLLHRTT
ncbi:MAG: polyprenyl synthetase family protein [Anaerolineaceae bacterium]|nr:polyprenyl synthetase family protein [Anaerolineaceae bacterium]